MAGHGLVIQMPMGEIPAGLGEGAEICIGLHGGDAREFLAEVVRIAAAVVRGMQQAVEKYYSHISTDLCEKSGVGIKE